MAKLNIQNKTRNPFKIPSIVGFIESGLSHVAPGETGVIDAEKHAKLMKGSQAYAALVEQRKLIVSPMRIASVDDEELEFTAAAEKPLDLDESLAAEGSEGDILATVNTKSVDVIDAPELTPQQKAANTRAANKAAKAAKPAQK